MKKKILITILILFLLLLLVPIPNHLKDGGTIEYKALIYKISKVHRLNYNSKNGYDRGLSIEVFGIQIYNNIKESDSEIDEIHYSKKIDNTMLEMNIPKEWNYEEIPKDEKKDYKYALKLYKNEENKNVILYFYNNPFGFCGTGATTKEITLNNGVNATIIYYNDSKWSAITFYKLNPNIAFINNGLDSKEAEEVLEFVKTLTITNYNLKEE